jgi:hypothetical protein
MPGGRRTSASRPGSADPGRDPGGSTLSVTQLIAVEERSKQRAAEEASRQEAGGGRSTGSSPGLHATPGTETGGGRSPGSSPGLRATPGTRRGSAHASLVSKRDALSDAAEARDRKRREADEEISLVRRMALERFPSDSVINAGMTPQQVRHRTQLPGERERRPPACTLISTHHPYSPTRPIRRPSSPRARES